MMSRLLPFRLAGSAANVARCNYMTGPGSRGVQNTKPRSLSIEGLKKHWDLVPLFAVMTVAMTGVVLYIGRLATKTPDITWRKVECPSDDYANKPLKLISTHPREKDFYAIPEGLLKGA